jgi:hypothetical protein
VVAAVEQTEERVEDSGPRNKKPGEEEKVFGDKKAAEVEARSGVDGA